MISYHGYYLRPLFKDAKNRRDGKYHSVSKDTGRTMSNLAEKETIEEMLKMI